jgi:nitrogen regulatory protein P-II 2
MASLQTIRRITVYSAQELEKTLLGQFHAMGAKGYTLSECRGVGEHATIEDPFARSTHVRIELLVQPAVADKIIDYLSKLHAQRKPVAACVESVQVADPEHF